MSQDKQMPKGKKTASDAKPTNNKYGNRGTGKQTVVKKGQSKTGQPKVGQGKGKKTRRKTCQS